MGVGFGIIFGSGLAKVGLSRLPSVAAGKPVRGLGLATCSKMTLASSPPCQTTKIPRRMTAMRSTSTFGTVSLRSGSHRPPCHATTAKTVEGQIPHRRRCPLVLSRRAALRGDAECRAARCGGFRTRRTCLPCTTTKPVSGAAQFRPGSTRLASDSGRSGEPRPKSCRSRPNDGAECVAFTRARLGATSIGLGSTKLGAESAQCGAEMTKFDQSALYPQCLP